jgi:hypothetical protein
MKLNEEGAVLIQQFDVVPCLGLDHGRLSCGQQ